MFLHTTTYLKREIQDKTSYQDIVFGKNLLKKMNKK